MHACMVRMYIRVFADATGQMEVLICGRWVRASRTLPLSADHVTIDDFPSEETSNASKRRKLEEKLVILRRKRMEAERELLALVSLIHRDMGHLQQRADQPQPQQPQQEQRADQPQQPQQPQQEQRADQPQPQQQSLTNETLSAVHELMKSLS